MRLTRAEFDDMQALMRQSFEQAQLGQDARTTPAGRTISFYHGATILPSAVSKTEMS